MLFLLPLLLLFSPHSAHATINNAEPAVDLLGQFASPPSSDTTDLYTTACPNNGATSIGIYSYYYDLPWWGGKVAIDTTNHYLFVADTQNNRVLVYALNTNNTINSKTPSYILGQTNSTNCMPNETNTTTPGASTLWNPMGLAVDSANQRLFVADVTNDRVLVFVYSSGFTTGMNASYELGQASGGTAFTTDNYSTTISTFNGPWDVAYDSANTRLFVADANNNRVLVFNVAPGFANGKNASYVLGEPNFTSDGDGGGIYGCATASQSILCFPEAVAYDSTNTRLFVADSWNNRVMVFSAATSGGGAIATGENAANVLGYSVYTVAGTGYDECYGTEQAGLCVPTGLAYDSTNNRLFVGDSYDSRIMVFSTSSISNGENASSELGQPNFTTFTGNLINQQSMGVPTGLALDSGNNVLYALDSNNNRVMLFNTASASATPSVISQSGGDGCAITTGGALYCWGWNIAGEDGIGNAIIDQEQPLQVGSATNWIAISLGDPYLDADACGIAGGGLYCWGNNEFGELGNGTTSETPVTTPTQLGSATNWSLVSTSGYDTCATTTGGALYCWGLNAHGELGINSSTQYTTPQLLPSLPIANLVGWWKLTDGSGTSAADSSGFGNTGTLENGPTWITSGENGGGLTLDGATQYVQVNDAASLDISSSWTVSAWVNFAALPGSGSCAVLIDKENSGSTNYQLCLDNGSFSTGVGWVVNYNSTGCCDNHYAKYVTTPSTGTWYLVTGVYSSSAQTLTLYVNGTSVSSNSSVAGYTPEHGGGSTLDLGNQAGVGNYLNGSLDDARVYNVALTAAQVSQLYSGTWSAVSTGGDDTCGINNGLLYCWGYNQYGEVGSSGNANTVFVTSTTYTGNLGGVAGANADCAARATAAGLSGTYLAWIAETNANSPSDTFTQSTGQYQSTGPYVEVDGTVVASNWAGLTSGTLTNAITLSEYGSTVTGDAWTNVSTSGTANHNGSSATLNCTNWANASSPVGSHGGNFGLIGQTGSTWTADTNIACNSTNHLYCVQQPPATPVGSKTPVQIGTATNWTAITQGGWDTCGIAGGTLYCWGLNSTNEFGLGNEVQFNSPQAVGALTNWSAITIQSDVGGNVAYPSTCGIAGGALYCMGGDEYGDIPSTGTTPTQYGTDTTWTGISYGLLDTCGIDNGVLYCQGYNQYGEDGVGNTTNNTTPQVVTLGAITAENATDLLGQYTSATSTATVNWNGNGPNNGATALGLWEPADVAVDSVNHRLFVADTWNNRVLVYTLNTDNSIPTSSGGHTAAYVLGQTNFSNDTANQCNCDTPSASSMATPGGLAFDSGNNRLFVSDTGNSRVLVFNTSSISNGMSASYVLGQPDFTTGYDLEDGAANDFAYQNQIAYDSTNSRLFVADAGDSRVTVFLLSGGITNNMNATYVLGQAGFGGGDRAANVSVATLNTPIGVAYDPVNLRVFVSDYNNNRVVVFNVPTSTNITGENASYELGQPDFNSYYYNQCDCDNATQYDLWDPELLSYDPTNSRLFVPDNGNNRVLVFNVGPSVIANQENAAYVLGQPDFVSNGPGALVLGTTQSLLALDPEGLTTSCAKYDPGSGRLFVCDTDNNRIMIFGADFMPSWPADIP